ncbi:MAG: class II aldolase/adducin family protein [Verrucomicrobia bacterium]|nr:class II aldolase/adducin family protein [Verrucomicrobiota bacterium]MBV9671783.1 class II aldolase/adducin family protein [Verrucomicrobiota bacterium]
MAYLSAFAVQSRLLDISHEFGSAKFSILGEGNTSGRLDEETFVVKASGSNLESLTKLELVTCRFDKLLPSLDQEEVSEEAIEDVLLQSRVLKNSLKPSVETFFHAHLLTIPGVKFVGHTHPIPVNQILCSGFGKAFGEERRFPDEVVCCGPKSLLIPYEDPGLALAKRIRADVCTFQETNRTYPKVILLENHGLITVGDSAEAVRVAMLMTVKAAEIFAGAQALGSIIAMSPTEVSRIESRLDEEYRRRILHGQSSG